MSEISIGDTVELLAWHSTTTNQPGDLCVVTGVAYGWINFKSSRHPGTAGWPLKHCRLVSKGAKQDEPLKVGDWYAFRPYENHNMAWELGQVYSEGHACDLNELTKDPNPKYRRATAEEIARVKGQGVACSPTGTPDTSGPREVKKAPCPACGGSGRQPGFTDFDTVPCGKCQYGKPAKEPEIKRPYHKMLPSGECVLCDMVADPYKSFATETDHSGFVFRTEKEVVKKRAIAALAKAKAECKRLGLEA